MKLRVVVILFVIAALAIWIVNLNPSDSGAVGDLGTVKSDDHTHTTETTKIEPENLPDGVIEGSGGLTLDKFLNKLNIAIQMPVEVHGQVLDLDGAPIPNAKINYSLENKINKSGAGFSPLKSTRMKPLTTDEEGRFHITGKGASTYIQAYKDGYYQIDESSENISAIKQHKANSPLRLYLRKMSITDRLERLNERKFLNKGVNQITVRLDSKVITVNVTFNSNYENRINDPNRRFAWSAEITIEGGQIVERVAKDQYDYTAPIDGYISQFTFSQEPDMTEQRWHPSLRKEFYIRFEDSTFARVEMRVVPVSSTPFFMIRGYYNPSGNRNLEYDPSLDVASP